MPHLGHFLARGSDPNSVSAPHLPQNRCVRFHSTICFARPAFRKKPSSTLHKLRRSRNTIPSGASASGARSTAKQGTPSRTPISCSKAPYKPRSFREGACGTLTELPSSRTSNWSPRSANHRGVPVPLNRLGVTVEAAGEVHGRVLGAATGSAQDLLAARGSWSYYNALVCLPYSREQPPLPHLHRDLVLALFVTKLSGHSTTPRIYDGDLCPWREREHLLGRPRPNKGLLVAMPVQQHRRAVPQRQLRLELQH